MQQAAWERISSNNKTALTTEWVDEALYKHPLHYITIR